MADIRRAQTRLRGWVGDVKPAPGTTKTEVVVGEVAMATLAAVLVVGEVAMATLAAVLVLRVRFSALRPDEHGDAVRDDLHASRSSRRSSPPFCCRSAVAVGIGVALSLLLQLNREALDLAVVQRTVRADGRIEEGPAPTRLASGEVTTLIVYGSLFYAGARTLQVRLPDPAGSHEPVVVLRLRGRTSLGATFVAVLADYAKRLDAVGGRLYLSGVDESLMDLLDRTGQATAEGPSTRSRQPQWSARRPRRPRRTPRRG